MSDKEQVYQYPDEEFIDQGAAELEPDAAASNAKRSGSAPDSVMGKLQAVLSQPGMRRMLTLVCILGVVLPLGTRIYNAFAHHPDSAILTKLKAQQAASAAPAVAAPTVSAVPAAPVASASQDNSIQNQQLINQTSQQVAVMSAQLQNIQAELNRLSKIETDSVKSQSDDQGMMMKLVSDMAAEEHEILVAQKQKTIKQLSASASKQLVATLRSQMGVKHNYNVQGVVPGLAWLVDEHGKTSTVRVGTELNGYGKVTYIDSDKDIVQTSSGRNIHETP